MDLIEKSLNLILQNQAPSGAFPAALSFAPYRYCWIRDGSFIAYAALMAGRRDVCKSFLSWVDRVICRHSARVDELEAWLAARPSGVNGERVPVFLPTRYDLDGFEVRDNWPSFQIDGYGSWLWCVAQYARMTGDASVVGAFSRSIETVTRYLSLLWRHPNYDCWEENGTDIHPSTLACVYGGLSAINGFLQDDGLSGTARSIREFVLSLPGPEGAYPKLVGSSKVDASLLWLSVPFGLAEPLDPRMRATVEVIERKLMQDGGVKRYEDDTFYGGGQWILLTAWLGWYYARTGRKDRATECLQWVIAQSDANGDLPEQVLSITNDPDFIETWRTRWGDVAKPLLWSHAMYLVLYAELYDRDETEVAHARGE